MSMARSTIGHTGPGESWVPAFTPGEAVTAGIPKREYDQAFLFARATVKEHQKLDTSRDQWEPTPIVNHKLAGPFIADGEQELVKPAREGGQPCPRQVPWPARERQG